MQLQIAGGWGGYQEMQLCVTGWGSPDSCLQEEQFPIASCQGKFIGHTVPITWTQLLRNLNLSQLLSK